MHVPQMGCKNDALCNLKCPFFSHQANLERLGAMLRVSSAVEEAEADDAEEGMFDDAD